jgi:hypothetical protein
VCLSLGVCVFRVKVCVCSGFEGLGTRLGGTSLFVSFFFFSHFCLRHFTLPSDMRATSHRKVESDGDGGESAGGGRCAGGGDEHGGGGGERGCDRGILSGQDGRLVEMRERERV